MIFIQCSHDSIIIRHDFSLASSFDLVKEGHTLGKSHSGSLAWNHQQATERPAGASLSRTPWEIRVADQGHGQHREGEERMLMLAEVHCHCANRNAAAPRQALGAE